MRRVMLALLVLNILYALWSGLRPAPALPDGRPGQQYPETLVLLEEVDRPLVAIEQPPAYCPALGPFANESDLRAFAEAHLSGRQWQTATETQALSPMYRVYVSSAGADLAGTALLASVRDTIDAAGLEIDTYLVVGGDLGGVVSLGLFANESNASAVYQQAAGLDLAVEMQSENRFRNLYSIVLSRDESADFIQQSVAALQSLDLDAGITEKLCEMIALPD